MKECKIYLLRDPSTNEVRYVGRTINIHTRLSGHLGRSNNPIKQQWIDEMIKQNKEPIIEEIETVEAFISPERELFWIEHYESKGCNLVNVCKPRKLKNCGIRFNGGRKPAEDPKVALVVYVQQSKIDSLGGIEEVRKLMIERIEKAYKKQKQTA